MNEIHWGLWKELDVSLYAKPEFSVEQMRHARWDLEKVGWV
jgi:hypothetical protein